MPTLWFQKDLVAGFISELHDLILDGGAIPWTYTLDGPGIEWGQMEV
jgi:hypothetical protein